MHHVSSKEVVEGNLKAIMRLILALAAHYKPQSVRTSPYDSSATCAASAADTGELQRHLSSGVESACFG